ncbi:MAG: tail fiber domain-containing protein [Bacteroidota bacterium]
MKRLFLLPFMFATVQLTAQNVGVGILNPTRGKLEVQGIGNTMAIFGGEAQGVSIQQNNPAIGFNQYFDGTTSRYIGTGYAAVQWLNPAIGEMYFDLFGPGLPNDPYSTITRSITVSKTGNVGIGTAPLSYARVAVARGTGDYGTAVFLGTNWASHFNYSTAENTYIRGGKPGSYVYLNNVAGGEVLMGSTIASIPTLVRVGINNSNPSYALEMRQVNGKGLIMVATSNFANWHFKVGPTLAPGAYQLLYYDETKPNAIGAFHPQTGAYAALSDERVKTGIMPMADLNGQLQKMAPVQYQVDVPQAGTEMQSGFIAQDMLQLFPDLVTHHKEAVPGADIPDMHLLNYDGIAVYAIKFIQEQQFKIEELKKRLDKLKQPKQTNLKP